jgi:hypothetical protein
MLNESKITYPKNIEKSIVVIIPEEKLISFKNNPRGEFEDSKNY